MAKKSIQIIVTDPDLELPKHLQKPPDVEIQIDGLSVMEVSILLNAALSKFLSNLNSELLKQNINHLKKL